MLHRKGRKHDDNWVTPIVIIPVLMFGGMIFIWLIAFVGSHLDKLLR